ncbi:hypothetical protein P43SY_002543 [Pythium insidiosum]|uniref:Coronin n=1 Tax=Pythium insidiosum TaxID=114742 RepID=A0AAD5MA27_PYTIN|nr:hypothetical protein P43SY_002543 [Pythium insidiosum]
MAPRLPFHVSKFRNIECKPLPRDHGFDQLQVTTAAVDGNALAATLDHFAYPHQMNGGAAIQVLPLDAAGKRTVSNDLWKLPPPESEWDDLHRSPVSSFSATDASSPSSFSAVRWHPSAQGIFAALDHRQLSVFDVSESQGVFRLAPPEADDGVPLCAVAWSYDGSRLAMASQRQRVHVADPRTNVVACSFDAHAGRRRPTNVVWGGRDDDVLITAGSDAVNDRELRVWDPRNISSSVARVRLDSGVGPLFLLFDTDVNLLYVLGRGDRSARCLELDMARGPFLHALDHSALAHMTLAATLLPKQNCDTRECEVARVLNLSGANGGLCDVLSYRVPRRDALVTFQSDLYPQTRAFRAALSAESWRRGENALPTLEAVSPTPASSESSLASVFSRPQAVVTQWSAPVPASTVAETPAEPSANGWGANVWSASATSAPASSGAHTSGWNSKATAWNAAPQTVAAAAAEPAPAPLQWASAVTTKEETPATVEEPAMPTFSEKAKRLGSVYGHKLKYIKGKASARGEAFHLGDRTPLSGSTAILTGLQASSAYWAVPLAGAGGPVLVAPLEAAGKAGPEHPVLNGHKAAVTDLAFHTFQPDVLATASGDSTIAVWRVDSTALPQTVLRGHTKGVRSLLFHPCATNVLCSTGQDLSIRLWDVEAGAERICLTDKLEDTVWNSAFSSDGALLATSSRARILRVFDPRATGHALVAMGCALDSPRPQLVSWLSPSQLFTVGTNPQNLETQLRLWDARNLVEPVSIASLASADAGSTPLPFYDESSRALFMVGMGGRHIWSYEIDAASDAVVHANLPFVADGTTPISGAVPLPKSLCDVRGVEIAKFLVLRGGAVERVSFSLPRAERLKQYFQDDVFGAARSTTRPSLSASEWFDRHDAVVQYDSLCPPGMTPLSEAPPDDESRNQATAKSLFYRAKWEQEEREKQLKAERLDRLQALAQQPSLHSQFQPRSNTGRGDDSDDDWDD